MINPTFDNDEDILLYPDERLEANPTNGGGVFAVAVVLLASFFYALPFIRMPWGYSSNMRLDDIMTVLMLLAVAFGTKNSYLIQKTKAGQLLIMAVIGIIVFFVLSQFVWGGLGTVRNRLYAMWQIVRYVGYIMVFFLAGRVVYNPRRLTIIMWVVFLGGVFVALYGLGQYYGYISVTKVADMFKDSIDWQKFATKGRVRELLGPLSPSHAYCGMILGTVLIFVWVMFSGKGTFSKLILLGGGGIIFYAMILTRARAPLYAFALAMIIKMTFLKGRFKGMILIVGALLVFNFALVNVPYIRDRFLLKEGLEAGTAGGRVRVWFSVIEWFVRHPAAWFTGVGVGNWKAAVQRDIGYNAAHNNYFHYLVEMGFIGFTFFLVALGMAVKDTFRLARSSIPHISVWGQAMFTTVIFWSISAVSQENFVPSPVFGSLLGFMMFLLGVSCWAKEYANEATLDATEYTYWEPMLVSGNYV